MMTDHSNLTARNASENEFGAQFIKDMEEYITAHPDRDPLKTWVGDGPIRIRAI